MTKKEKRLAGSFQKILIISTILSVAIIFAFRMVWHYSFLKSGLSSTEDSIKKLYQKEVKNYAKYNARYLDEFLDDLQNIIEREIGLCGNSLHSVTESIYRENSFKLGEVETKRKIEENLWHLKDSYFLNSITIIDSNGTIIMTNGIDGIEGKSVYSFLSHEAQDYTRKEIRNLFNSPDLTKNKYLSYFWILWLHNYRNNIYSDEEETLGAVPPVIITDKLKQTIPPFRSIIINHYVNDREIGTVLGFREFKPYKWGIIYEYNMGDRWSETLNRKLDEVYTLVQGLYEDVKVMSLFIDSRTEKHIFLGNKDYWLAKKDLISFIKKTLIENYKDREEKEGFFSFEYPYGKNSKNYICSYKFTTNPKGVSVTVIEEGAKFMGTDYLGTMFKKQTVVEVLIIILLLSILLVIVLFWTRYIRRKLEHYVDYICNAFNSYTPGVVPFEMSEFRYWEWQKVADAANNMLEQRSKIEYELDSERALTEQLFSRNINAVVLITPSGKIMKANPSFNILFGYEDEEVVGKNIDDLIVPDGMMAEATCYTNQAVTIDNISFEARRKHKCGRLIDVQVYTTPVIVNDNVVAIYSIYEDISLKKKAEQQIIKAKEEALAASKAKSSFLATVSHEIRTPLNGIIGMTEVMTNTALNKEQHEYLEIIQNSGETLLVIINDILDLSKMESGNLDIVDKMFDLDRCLASCLDVISSEAEHKGIETILAIEPSVPKLISADEFRIRQVLLNFISNAIKFTENGEIQLRVSIVEENSSNMQLRFELSDTGIGIPEDKLESIFDTFTQADSTITRKYGGTGLGLAISRKIIQLLGGEINVQSKVGEGTVFSFELNVGEWERVPLDAKIISNIKNNKALLVDSNDNSIQVHRKYLESFSLKVEVVKTCIEAKSLLSNGSNYDYCIINDNIPDNGYFKLAKEIRKVNSSEHLKLIFLKYPGATSSTLSYFQAILRKPVSLYRLLPAFMEDNRELREQKSQISRELYNAFAEEFPLRILLAEDNIVNQKLAYHLLGKLGYSLDIVDNGQIALEYCLRDKYDIVLMDLQMPVMDGITASKEIIARIPKKERPYLIALTANSAELNRKECLDIGMDDFISKPFKARELKERFVKVYNEKYM